MKLYYKVRKVAFVYLLLLFVFASCGNRQNNGWVLAPPEGVAVSTVAVDTMDLRNPFVVYDKRSDSYIMTGDGGHLWRSNNLRVWEGPYSILLPRANTWMGENPIVQSPEIHAYKGKYYFMATFTNPAAVIVTENGDTLPRTACEVFESDSLCGPYKPLTDSVPLLAADEYAEHPTFCTDELNVGYMIYNHSAKQIGDATVQIVRLGKKLTVRVGEPFIMFRASGNPWSGSSEMWAPFLFDTRGRELGILFSTKMGDGEVIGVAYTEKDHGLSGPWHIEPQPLLAGNVGSPMLFNDYDGTTIMVVHKDTTVNGKAKSVPQFIKADRQFDKLKLNGHYKF